MQAEMHVEMESLLELAKRRIMKLEEWIESHKDVEVIRFGGEIQMIDKSCESRQIKSKLERLKYLPDIKETTVEAYIIEELDRLYKILMRGRKGRFINVL